MRCFRCDWRAISGLTATHRLIESGEDFNAFIQPGEWFDLDEVSGGCCILTRIAHQGCSSVTGRCCSAWPGLVWRGSLWSHILPGSGHPGILKKNDTEKSHYSEGASVPAGRLSTSWSPSIAFSMRTPSSHGYLMDTTSGPSAPSSHSILHPACSFAPPTSRPWGIILKHLRWRERRAPMCRDKTWISQEEPSLSNGTRFMKREKKSESAPPSGEVLPSHRKTPHDVKLQLMLLRANVASSLLHWFFASSWLLVAIGTFLVGSWGEIKQSLVSFPSCLETVLWVTLWESCTGEPVLPAGVVCRVPSVSIHFVVSPLTISNAAKCWNHFRGFSLKS